MIHKIWVTSSPFVLPELHQSPTLSFVSPIYTSQTLKHHFLYLAYFGPTPPSTVKARVPEQERRAISGATISSQCSPQTVRGVFTKHLLFCISELIAMNRDSLKRSRLFLISQAFLQYLAAPSHIEQSIWRPQERISQRTEVGLCVDAAAHELTVCNHCQAGRVEIHFYTH